MLQETCKTEPDKMENAESASEKPWVTLSKYEIECVKAEALIKNKSGIRLDIGCGGNKQEGFIGLDMRDLPGVDIVWDCEEFPWPLPDDSVVVAMASHLLEHINPHKGGFLCFMDEVWRVMQPGGQFMIAVPHGSSQGYLQDPTHCNQMNEATWAYFDPLEPNTKGLLYRIYTPKPWKLEHLNWSPAANMEVILRKRLEDDSYTGNKKGAM